MYGVPVHVFVYVIRLRVQVLSGVSGGPGTAAERRYVKHICQKEWADPALRQGLSAWVGCRGCGPWVGESLAVMECVGGDWSSLGMVAKPHSQLNQVSPVGAAT